MNLLRHEIKYLISYQDYHILRSKLKAAMSQDPFSNHQGRYHVRSLYFDDQNYRCLHEKIEGQAHREKFRIRIYNLNEGLIKLECKKKREQWVEKETEEIAKELCQEILNFDKASQSLACDRFPLVQRLIHEMRHLHLTPMRIIDFVREAYVLDFHHIRVTFDQQVKMASQATDLFSPKLPTFSCLDGSQVILEIKFRHFLPNYLKNLIQSPSQQRMAISKYALGSWAVLN